MTQTLHIAEPLFERLRRHLFPGDRDEHGAVILAGVAESARGTRLLAREVVLAKDGVDYVPGRHGYRALTADFVARLSDRCSREKLSYLAVHCHRGRDEVGFSPDDIASQKRGYPALLDITDGGPVGALVFAENALAGNIWRPSGVSELDYAVVIGPNLRRIYPRLQCTSGFADPMYHRQSLLFGNVGQERLARAKVGVIGLGGVGSLISQWLAHLGVGHIVGIDFDRIEPTNRPRVVGATAWRAGEPFIHSHWGFIRRFGERIAIPKAILAARVARRANPAVRYEPIVGTVVDDATARRLTDCDYLFLGADPMPARLVFNALVHQYLIPGVQIGAKVPVEKSSGDVLDPFVVARRVLPYARGGCLQCNELIPPTLLQEQSLSPEELRRQRYVDDQLVTAPSVITLNAQAAAQAANDFLFAFHGLLLDGATDGYMMHYPRERKWVPTDSNKQRPCLHCRLAPVTMYARGDRGTLPCKNLQSQAA